MRELVLIFSVGVLGPNAALQARPIAGARHEQRLLGVAFRVEPVVTQPAPPQTRTCAMNASGSSVARVLARLWHLTMLPCKPPQMLWTMLGVGRTEVCMSFSNFAHPIELS